MAQDPLPPGPDDLVGDAELASALAREQMPHILVAGRALSAGAEARLREAGVARVAREALSTAPARHSIHRFCTAEGELQRGHRVPPPLMGRTVGTRHRHGPPVFLPVVPPDAGDADASSQPQQQPQQQPPQQQQPHGFGRVAARPLPEMPAPPKAQFYPADVARYLAPHFRPQLSGSTLQSTRPLPQMTVEPLDVSALQSLPDVADEGAGSWPPAATIPPSAQRPLDGASATMTLPLAGRSNGASEPAVEHDALTVLPPTDFVRIRNVRILHPSIGESLSLPPHIVYRVICEEVDEQHASVQEQVRSRRRQ